MILERDIERALVKYCNSKGYSCIKITGCIGFPDRMVLKNGGKTVFVELKAPNKKPRKAQLKWHEDLRKMGFPVFVIDNKEDVTLIDDANILLF